LGQKLFLSFISISFPRFQNLPRYGIYYCIFRNFFDFASVIKLASSFSRNDFIAIDNAASFISLVCAIYGLKFKTMLLSILVNDNQAKLLFLQPQFQNCLEFLFCIQFINVHFLSQFFSGWFAMFLISFLVVVCTFFIVAFRAQNFIDTCCQVKECKRFEKRKGKICFKYEIFRYVKESFIYLSLTRNAKQ